MKKSPQKWHIYILLGIAVVVVAAFLGYANLQVLVKTQIASTNSITGACYKLVSFYGDRAESDPVISPYNECTVETKEQCEKRKPGVYYSAILGGRRYFVAYTFVPRSGCDEYPHSIGATATGQGTKDPDLCQQPENTPTDKLKDQCRKMIKTILVSGISPAKEVLCPENHFAISPGTVDIGSTASDRPSQCKAICGTVFKCVTADKLTATPVPSPSSPSTNFATPLPS